MSTSDSFESLEDFKTKRRRRMTILDTSDQKSKKQRPQKSKPSPVVPKQKTPPPKKPQKKKRDGTPDKPTLSTVSQETVKDLHLAVHDVIMDDEIEALAIKYEDLEKLYVPPIQHVSPKPLKDVTVKKYRSLSPIATNVARYVVAKPAPPDSLIKPVESSAQTGVRFDNNGNLVSHSILGSCEMFLKEAKLRGNKRFIIENVEQNQKKSKELERASSPEWKYISRHLDETRALHRWKDIIMERKTLIKSLAKRICKDPEKLLISVHDGFREKQELRELVDYGIARLECGKGSRLGSEFWTELTRLGDEEYGIYDTLKRSERGDPLPFERIGLSNSMMEEQALSRDERISKMWMKSLNRDGRLAQLMPYMKELYPYSPDFSNLDIIAAKRVEPEIVVDKTITCNLEVQSRMDQSDVTVGSVLDQYPDVHDEDVIIGPSILFAGHLVQWTGNDDFNVDKVAIEARVLFDTPTNQNATSQLTVVNNGTTIIHYRWEKIAKENPLGIHFDHKQRMYFDISNGSISPGESRNFIFVFKSEKGGIFTEQWKLVTEPVLCGGADLLITLKGIAMEEDSLYQKRLEIDELLKKRQMNEIVSDILQTLINSVRSTQTPQTPIDTYITREEAIVKANPKLHLNYNAVLLNDMVAVYQETDPEQEWDYTTTSVKEACLKLDDEAEEKREDLLKQLNDIVVGLSFSRFLPREECLHSICCQLLREAIDAIVGQSLYIRFILSLPFSAQDSSPDEERKRAGKREVKKSPSKEMRQKSSTKIDAKNRARSGNKTPLLHSSNRQERYDSATPQELSLSPDNRFDEFDPGVERKYTERLYSQTYLILAECIDRMVEVSELSKMNCEYENSKLVSSSPNYAPENCIL